MLEKPKRVLGPEAHFTLVTTDNLAIVRAENHQPAEAERLQQESLAIHLKVEGAENLSTIHAIFNLGEFQRIWFGTKMPDSLCTGRSKSKIACSGRTNRKPPRPNAKW